MPNKNQQSSVDVEYVNEEGEVVDEQTDYMVVDAELSKEDIKRLENGAGTTWEFDTEDGEVGVYIGPKSTAGLREAAFKHYVEEEYDARTYRFDLASRVVRTRSFWARVASYTAALLAAPFIIAATGNNVAIAFTYGVLVMALLPMLLDVAVADPTEAAKHE